MKAIEYLIYLEKYFLGKKTLNEIIKMLDMTEEEAN